MKIRWMKRAAALMLAAMLTASGAGAAENTDEDRLNIYYSLAVSYTGREEYDKAMENIEKALKLCTEEENAEMYADLHLKKGCVHVLRGEYEEALPDLDEATRVDPDLSDPYLVRVQVYTEQNELEKAAADLEKYIALTGENDLQETLAQIYLELENGEAARESYRKLAEHVSEDPALILYNLAVYEINAGMYEEALENLLSCEADEEKMPGLHYNTGLCRMMLKNYEEAAADFTASIEKEDFYFDALYNRALCNVSIQNFDSAITDLTEYIDRPQEEAVTEADEAVEAESEGAEEIKDAGEASDSGQTEELAYYYRAVSYLSVGRYAEGAADFTVCLEKEINPDESLFNRGLCYLQDEQYENAQKDFTDSIENGYLPDDALFYRSYAYRNLGDNESALRDLTECIEHDYLPEQTYQQRAQVYQALGDEEHYLEDLETALTYLEE